MVDDFDPDPFGCLDAHARVIGKEPGCLDGLYSSVLAALQSGEEVPAEIVLRLLNEMGPPRKTKRQLEQLEVLGRVKLFQAFPAAGEIVSDRNGTGSFRAACLKVYAEINQRDYDGLNTYEKSIVDGEVDSDDLYKRLYELNGKRRHIK